MSVAFRGRPASRYDDRKQNFPFRVSNQLPTPKRCFRDLAGRKSLSSAARKISISRIYADRCLTFRSGWPALQPTVCPVNDRVNDIGYLPPVLRPTQILLDLIPGKILSSRLNFRAPSNSCLVRELTPEVTLVFVRAIFYS